MKALIGWEVESAEPLVDKMCGIEFTDMENAQAIVNRLADRYGIAPIEVLRNDRGKVTDHVEFDLLGCYRPRENQIWFFRDKVRETVVLHEFAHYWCTCAFCWPSTEDWSGGCSTPIKAHGPVFARALVELFGDYFEFDWRVLAKDMKAYQYPCAINEGRNVGLWRQWRQFSFIDPTPQERSALTKIREIDRVTRDYSSLQVYDLPDMRLG